MDIKWHSVISEELCQVRELLSKITKSDSEELTEVCDYVLSISGKKIRPSMCILTYRACGGKDPKAAIDVGTALEMIHNATLIHDDINDKADLRRGAKVAYKRFSVSKSIIAGDVMFALGFKLMRKASPMIIDFVVDASLSMGTGEFFQKDLEHDSNATEEDYMRIIDGKTARLIECAGKSGAFLAGSDMESLEQMGIFARNVGLAFQIIDDTLDIVGDQEVTGKTIGSDIMEGKPTLPLIYAMQDVEHGGRIKEIFESRTHISDMISEAIHLIKRTDAIQRCLEKSKRIVEDSIHHLDCLEDSIYKSALIDYARYSATRAR